MLMLVAMGVLAILLGARSGGGLLGLGVALVLLGGVLILRDATAVCATLTGAEWIRACG